MHTVRRAAGELGRQLASLIRKNCASTMAGLSILVAGLGNRQVTPDSLGPRVVDGLSMNRHLRTEPGRRNGTYLYTAEKAGRTVHPGPQRYPSRCDGTDRDGDGRNCPRRRAGEPARIW